MATKLHQAMVRACKKTFPHFNEDRTLRALNFKHLPLDGENSIPDLAAPNKSLAIECETLGKENENDFVTTVSDTKKSY